MKRWGAAIAVLSVACGDGETAATKVLRRWTHDTPGAAAPPSVGPEERVVVMVEEVAATGQGELRTLEHGNGRLVEGPFAADRCGPHAPIMSGTNIYFFTKIGQVAARTIAGVELFPPTAPYGVTTRMLLSAKKPQVRFGATSGAIVAVDTADGREVWRTPVTGAATGIAIGGDDKTWVTTGAGHVVGVDDTGKIVFDQMVAAPASGPSATADGVVAGDAGGVVRFKLDGSTVFDHARSAGVVGTKVLESGEIVAWGLDGVVEILSAEGRTTTRFDNGGAPSPPAVKADVIVLTSGRLAIFDEKGVAHGVSPEGTVLSTLDLGGVPLPEISVGDREFVFVAIGNAIQAIDFQAE